MTLLLMINKIKVGVTRSQILMRGKREKTLHKRMVKRKMIKRRMMTKIKIHHQMRMMTVKTIKVVARTHKIRVVIENLKRTKIKIRT